MASGRYPTSGLGWIAPAQGVEATDFGVCQRPIVDRLIDDDCQHDGGMILDDRWEGRAIDEMNRYQGVTAQPSDVG